MNPNNNDLINGIYLLLDDATRIYYDASIDDKVDNTAVTNYNNSKGRLTYYICFNKIVDYFFDKNTLDIYYPQAIIKIDTILKTFRKCLKEHKISKGELYTALFLIDINGFKNLSFPLESLTPFGVSHFFTYLLNASSRKKAIEITDGNFGVGSLAFYLASNLRSKVNLVGFDSQDLLVDVALRKSELLQIPLIMNRMDVLKTYGFKTNYIVSDLSSYDYDYSYDSFLYQQGIRYFPYLLLERLNSYCEFQEALFLVENDFFNHDNKNIFKDFYTKHFKTNYFLMLPETFMNTKEKQKCILSFKKSSKGSMDIPCLVLPNDPRLQVEVLQRCAFISKSNLNN